MVSPSVNPPGLTQIAPPPNELTAGSRRPAMTPGGLLRSFGFQLLALLLGIAMAFM